MRKNSTLSVLLATMLAAASFASAQTPASAPVTRAEVKAQATPIKSGTDGGAMPAPSAVAAPPGPPMTRAEVKEQATPMKSGNDGGAGAVMAKKPAPGDTTKTRAEVKSEINVNAIKAGGMSSEAVKVGGVSSPATAAELKIERAERKAAAKARREARQMNNKAGAGAAPMVEGKAQ